MVAEKGLQAHPTWLNKCIQLYETYLVRHGIMVVGPSGAGKSAILECLAGALTELGQKTVLWRMNPKARALLFGCFLHDSPAHLLHHLQGLSFIAQTAMLLLEASGSACSSWQQRHSGMCRQWGEHRQQVLPYWY